MVLPMSVNEYQRQLKVQFETIFPYAEIQTEWRTQIDRNIYSPRLDLAIGPFSYTNGSQLTNCYDILFEKYSDFINKIIEIHLKNINNSKSISEEEIQKKNRALKNFNFNSRCFIALEIENQVSKKHLMGGAINAAALGRIGIAVGYDEEKHRAFLRLYKYFEFLKNKKELNFSIQNLLVISKEQLDQLLGCSFKFIMS